MKSVALAIACAFVLMLMGCVDSGEPASTGSADSRTVARESAAANPEGARSSQQGAIESVGAANDEKGSEEKEDGEMKLSIDGVDVAVEWEGNQAVADLRELASDGPITVDLSPYGGFEQVGPLGSSLTSSDEQITAAPGDIVLYAGNQISIFHGSNSWAYTRLGHITDKTAGELADMLGSGDVSITISAQ